MNAPLSALSLSYDPSRPGWGERLRSEALCALEKAGLARMAEAVRREAAGQGDPRAALSPYLRLVPLSNPAREAPAFAQLGHAYANAARTGDFGVPLPAKVKALWSEDGEAPFFGSHLVTGDGQLYALGHDHALRAYRIADGRLAWTHDYSARAGQSAPGLCCRPGQVLLVPPRSQVATLCSATGEELWCGGFDGLRGLIAGPALSPCGLLAWLNKAGLVRCLHPGEGEERWERYLSSRVRNVGNFISMLALCGETLIAGTSAGEVWALSLQSGEELWRADLGQRALSGPVISPCGRVLFGLETGELACLSLESGAKLWRSLTDRLTAPPVVTGSLALQVLTDGSLLATELKSGEVAWHRRYRGASGTSRLAASGGSLLLGTLSNLLCLDTHSGEDLWWAPCNEHLSGLVVSDCGHILMLVGRRLTCLGPA